MFVGLVLDYSDSASVNISYYYYNKIIVIIIIIIIIIKNKALPLSRRFTPIAQIILK